MLLKNGLRSWMGTSIEEKTVRQADDTLQDPEGWWKPLAETGDNV